MAARGGGRHNTRSRGPVVRVRNISVVPRSVTRFVAFLVHLLFLFFLSLTALAPSASPPRSNASCLFGYRRCRPRSSLYCPRGRHRHRRRRRRYRYRRRRFSEKEFSRARPVRFSHYYRYYFCFRSTPSYPPPHRKQKQNRFTTIRSDRLREVISTLPAFYTADTVSYTRRTDMASIILVVWWFCRFLRTRFLRKPRDFLIVYAYLGVMRDAKIRPINIRYSVEK